MLECNDLSTSYNKKTILEHISFRLIPGQLTAVIGKNGTGKSTLIRCLQKQQPYKGTIYLNGVDIQKLLPKELARHIAFLPQALPCPRVTVGELICFGRNPYLGISRTLSDVDIAAIKSAVQLTGMDDYQQRMLSSLSGGERQRAFLAMILAQETEVLILDEPTTFMDMPTEAAFLHLLKELTVMGKTIAVILHNLSLAVKHCDQIIILADKQCAFSGSTKDCLNQRKIETTFGVRRITASDALGSEIIFTA